MSFRKFIFSLVISFTVILFGFHSEAKAASWVNTGQWSGSGYGVGYMTIGTDGKIWVGWGYYLAYWDGSL